MLREIQFPDYSVPSCRNMAEYSQAGILAALLLFSALTVWDVYVGRSGPQRPGLSPGGSPEPEPNRAAKTSMYTGPVLRFQYCIS